jgi:signal transduction histidine kinase/CheY-like chemotaxis protein
MELAERQPATPLQELQQQNQDLLQALDEVRQQKEQLTHLNRELEDTNRGVVALLAELDEKADYVKRASDVKMRFLANMTHEFRTPVNSILSLARLLLERYDGPLSSGQETQVTLMQRSAEALSQIIDDLLDLAKVEAGKTRVKPTPFTVQELFGALRGMLRPLLAGNQAIALDIEDPEEEIALQTDEAKVSQILRNFISNAIKYTERGEVRVRAARGAGDTVVFTVSDTGIGIAAEDQARIFDEFTQLDSALHQRSRGTGLGLPLSRKLATLLGGRLGVESTPGKGSTFFAVLPAHVDGGELSLAPDFGRAIDPSRLPVLVVEDSPEVMFLYDKYLTGGGYEMLPARRLAEARQWLRTIRPAAVILDILLESESTWAFMNELRENPRTRDVPIVVITVVGNEARARAQGADAFALKPVERGWLLSTLADLTANAPRECLLLIDDDPASRYLLKVLLSDTRYAILEAGGGVEGVDLARAPRPRAIFLDLVMPQMDGFEVVKLLKADPITRDIPVIIHTAARLGVEERRLLDGVTAFVPKESPTREAAADSVRRALAEAGLAATGEEPHA